MTSENLYFAGYFVLALFLGALVPKARTVAVILALALSALFPDQAQASFVMLFAIPAVVIAGFGPDDK